MLVPPLLWAVDGRRPGLETQRETAFVKEARLDQGEVVGSLAGEEFGQMNPVVCGARLLAQHGNLGRGGRERVKFFEELVAHHAVADNNDFHDESLHVRPHRGACWISLP